MSRTTRYMDEEHRPQYHYTAEKNMINDPNGLFFLDGVYHLCHQYNQHETVHWGHAVSTDLVRWSHEPVAIEEDSQGQIYSGTAVVDTDNAGGWQDGAPPVVAAFFTYAAHATGQQSQGIAISTDGGRTFLKPRQNIVLPNPGRKDFRDPKVLWHRASAAWVMVVTVGDHLQLYRSADLRSWAYASSWGGGQGSHEGVWECPDLFEAPVEGTDERRWIVSVSVDRGAPAGGSGMQYFVGNFDGTSFENENDPEVTLWHNYGQDYYAGITWSGAPDERRLMIAWTDNWLYRFDVPTSPFNGQLSLVHELHLVRTRAGLRLIHSPAVEVETLRGEPWQVTSIMITADAIEPLGITGDCVEIIAEWDLVETTATTFGVDVRVGAAERTRVGVKSVGSEVFLDRSRAGVIPNEKWTGYHAAAIDLGGSTFTMRVFVDRSSVEVFADGQAMLSDLVLPEQDSKGIAVFAEGGSAALRSLTVYPMRRVWPPSPNGIPGAAEEWDIMSGDFAWTRRGLEGSFRDTGVALRPLADLGLPLEESLAAPARDVVHLTIVGAPDGSPRHVLGEAAAGLAFGVDAATGSGYLVGIDRSAGSVTIDTLSGGRRDATIATAPFAVRTNHRYSLAAHIDHHDRSLRVHVDGREVLRARVGTPPGDRRGVFVRDSEAVFLPQSDERFDETV